MTTPRILVIEDNADLRIEIVDYLNFSSYYARSVGSIHEMQRALMDSHWDILLLDLGLPDGDGIAATTQLRETYGLQLGIIVVTARGQVEDRVEAISAGADAYLIKPINLKELCVTINHLYRRLQDKGRGDDAVWQLDRQLLQLQCPNKRKVALTMTEALLLDVLIANKGDAVSRELLCGCLPPSSLRHDTRRLDAILSRLRTKVKTETDITLPIHTMRNKGYVFSTDSRT